MIHSNFKSLLSTRQIIVGATLLLWGSLWGLRPGVFFLPPFSLLILSFFIIVLALKNHLRGVRFITLLVPPVLLYFATFFFLSTLPVHSPLWYLIFLFFAPLVYASLLSQNIFAVAVRKEEGTMPLLRAAHTASFIVVIATSFLFFSYLYNRPLSYLEQLFYVFLAVFFLSFCYFWSLSLDSTQGFSPTRILVRNSGFATFLILEAVVVAGFFPLKFSTRGLLLSTLLYSVLGIGRHRVRGELTLRIVFEYLFVLLLVLALMVFFPS